MKKKLFQIELISNRHNTHKNTRTRRILNKYLFYEPFKKKTSIKYC